VESRRVNGKPRPIILEYLGSAETLLQRLREGVPKKCRSYSHGTVAVMLDIAEQLQIVETINSHLPQQQLRDGFTVGGSLLLAAIGRICQPTSKRNWYEGWARHTSLSYLLRKSLSKLGSQHFWDQMEALPSATIPHIEEEIIKTLFEKEQITLETLLYDTSNFFTHIDSTNHRCTLAQRGRNKQKRMDLRQLGILLLLSRRDHLPLFHRIYQGNLQDRTVFKEYFHDMVERFKAVCGSLEEITLVFDQGNNSKKNLARLDNALYFVGALSPHHHKTLIETANQSMQPVPVGTGREIPCYRTRTSIWNLDLSVVVYVSAKLQQGQIRGVEQKIAKLFSKLGQLSEKIRVIASRGPKRTRESIVKKVNALITSYGLDDLICWQLSPLLEGTFTLAYWIDENQFNSLKHNWFGRRILITNRHDWSTAEILSAYWGQAEVEYAFKNLKNPFHLALRPQYHWTDQKIEVHAFICLIAYLLSMVAYKRAREKAEFQGSPHTLLEKLSAIRLGTFIESPKEKTKGPYKVTYSLEEMDPDIQQLAEAIGVTERRSISSIPFSVYTQTGALS
jgi:transposase